MKDLFQILLVVAAAVYSTQAAAYYKVCALPHVTSADCQALERGESQFTCVSVSDSVDCALKIIAGEADVGSFQAEEALLLASKGVEGVSVIAEKRHVDRIQIDHAFQAVAVVRSSHTGGLSALREKNFCHPGFNKKDTLWSDYVLQEFERKVAPDVCSETSISPAEDDALAIKTFFKSVCRPGNWSIRSSHDAYLRHKYPELCSICDVASNTTKLENNQCDYILPDNFGLDIGNFHKSALMCTTLGLGDVSYVAWQYVREYFNDNYAQLADFSLLCPNGSLAAITTELTAPCAWISQPWGLIISQSTVATSLSTDLEAAIPTVNQGPSWQETLSKILVGDGHTLQFEKPSKSLTTYLATKRDIPKPTTRCNRSMKWCTISKNETEKCEWVSAAGYVSGISPIMSCVQDTSSLHCIKRISENGADVTSIDSNLGYIARHPHNLTSAIYHETRRSKNSIIVILVKNSSNITAFEHIRLKKICFPEYNGLAFISFINAARLKGIIQTDCDYSQALSSLIDNACAPGARDPLHASSEKNADQFCKLCEGAQTPLDSCGVDAANPFFGNRGALKCLSEQGDLAVVELQNLKEHATALGLNPDSYSVLCRNGTLAVRPGFDGINDDCALSVTVDGEVVMRRNTTQHQSIQLGLETFDEKFGYGSYSIIQLYDPFKGVADLMFKDSTLGLTSNPAENLFALNYVKLFEHTEVCRMPPTTTAAPIETTTPDISSTIVPLSVLILTTFAILLSVIQ